MTKAIPIAACLCFVLAAVAAADPAPIPLQPSTGYRDYCDGFGKIAKKACPRGHVPARLWRALAFPPLGPGGECPVSMPHRISKLMAPALGSKPVYMRSYGYQGDYSAVDMLSPAPYGSHAYGTGWTVAKIGVTTRTGFHEPLLIRGQRLDGTASLGFSGHAGRRPFDAMQFPGVRLRHRIGKFDESGLGVWATAPGCYGVQIDGKTFRRDVVFRVVYSPSS